LAFVSRFTRVDAVGEARARIKHLGHVASRHVPNLRRGV
jgi:hypothetical protein